MGAPKYARFLVDFDEWFPQGLYLVGEITPVREYQSQEDKARNRPVRPRVDEVTGRPLFRGTFADLRRRRTGRNRSRWSSLVRISRSPRRRWRGCRFGRWCWKA
jgi:hypothetical protein